MKQFAKGKKTWAFWSGTGALQVAKGNAEATLESSAMGALFDNLTINGNWDIQMWASLSKAYAQHAAEQIESAEYRGFVGDGASNQHSIFNKIEQPQFVSMLNAKQKAKLKLTWYAVASDRATRKADMTVNNAGIAGVLGIGPDRAAMVALAEKFAADKAKNAPATKPDDKASATPATGPDTRSETEKKKAVQDAANDADKLLLAPNATEESIAAGLPAIKATYRLNEIDLIKEPDGKYRIEAKINPRAVTPVRILKKKLHTDFYPEKMDVKAVADGVVITYTTRAGKNFETKVGRSGHVTESKGFDLDLTTLGRGITEDPANKEKNKGQNSAHIIANWFGGSGYRKSLNLVTTSDHFNKVVMGRAEDDIVAWVKDRQIVKFNLKVSVDWGKVKEEKIVNEIIKQLNNLSTLPESDSEKIKKQVLRNLANFKTKLKAVEDVLYSGTGTDNASKTIKMPTANTGKDKWL
jgi:hypothetical protein